MNRFTISEMEEFSGIKAHTIRAWESRYNALTPSRSEGNTRYYDDHQLKRLLNIVSLLAFPKKKPVSVLCSMSNEEHYEMLNEILEGSTDKNAAGFYYISQLIS